MNKWILAGSLGAVFLITLVFSYGPGYGGSSLALLGSKSTATIEMSPSGMVTYLVTPKKLVTFQNVTNVTSVSPVLSPDINSADEYIPSQLPSEPSVPPVPTVTLEMSPQLPTAEPSTEIPTPPLSPTPILPVFTVTPVPTATVQSTKININTADLAELDNITGIGPVLAQRVIDYRIANGLFQKIEDIINVKGIGDKTFQKMRDEITI